MELKNLMGKCVKEMTEEELEERVLALVRCKIMKTPKAAFTKAPKAIKTNKEQQLTDLISKLDKEQIASLMQKLSESEKKQ